MIQTEAVLHLIFAAAGVAGCVVMLSLVLRAQGSWRRRAALATYPLVTPASLMFASPARDQLHAAWPGLDLLVGIVSGGEAGVVWLTMLALFREAEVPWVRFLSVPALMLLVAPAYLLPHEAAGLLCFWLWELASLALTADALRVVVLGRPAGAARKRSQRLWLSVLCAAGCVMYLVLMLLVAASQAAPAPRLWRPAYEGLLMAAAVMILAVTAAVMEPRRRLLPPERSAPPRDLDEELLERLQALMQADAPWRSEGLSLADLAARLEVPEYRLRRLINGRLGHRNVAAFINGFRVEAAKALLADPARRLNVAQVAYEVGFASLAPFNRAFKAATGVTPSDWRREMLIES